MGTSVLLAEAHARYTSTILSVYSEELLFPHHFSVNVHLIKYLHRETACVGVGHETMINITSVINR